MDSAPSNFSDFSFQPAIQKAISAAGYDQPTPIQRQAIPHVLRGSDVLGLAQTGTGKTAAFALPILERLMEGERNRVRALVLVPTRELAEQVGSVFRKLAEGTKLRTCTVYGGASFEKQKLALHQRSEIVVACPGRLLDHMQRRTIRLDALEVLVLDEADQMLDMGFLPTIRSIVKALPPRQTLLFSATMPKEIRGLAENLLKKPVHIEADRGGPAKTVSHTMIAVSQGDKANFALELLRGCGEGSVLVFTRTKHRAKRLALQLGKSGLSSTCLQGNMSQNKRQESMAGFRNGKYQIMVATDIAARGIDISNVTHVINFDVPGTVEAYTHRIGRTGRAAQTGSAITFVAPEDDSMARSIKKLVAVDYAKSVRLGAGALISPADVKGAAAVDLDRRDPRPSNGRQSQGRGSNGRSSNGRSSNGRSSQSQGQGNRGNPERSRPTSEGAPQQTSDRAKDQGPRRRSDQRRPSSGQRVAASNISA